jgi:hypothetical protein
MDAAATNMAKAIKTAYFLCIMEYTSYWQFVCSYWIITVVPSDTDNTLSFELERVPSLAVKRRKTVAAVVGGTYVQELVTVPATTPLHPVPRLPPPLTIDQLQVMVSPFGSKAVAARGTADVPVETEAGTPILEITGAAGAVLTEVLPFALNG